MQGFPSRFWLFLQRNLFPMLDEEPGPLAEEGERLLVAALELIEIEQLVCAPLRGVALPQLRYAPTNRDNGAKEQAEKCMDAKVRFHATEQALRPDALR